MFFLSISASVYFFFVSVRTYPKKLTLFFFASNPPFGAPLVDLTFVAQPAHCRARYEGLGSPQTAGVMLTIRPFVGHFPFCPLLGSVGNCSDSWVMGNAVHAVQSFVCRQVLEL